MNSANEPLNFTLDPAIAHAFGVSEDATPLPGGEGRTYRSGDVVLRHEGAGMTAEAEWLAALFAAIEPDGFRISRPVPTREGGWIAQGEWSAWTFVEGQPATRAEIPEIIPAVRRFHAALASVARPVHLDERQTPWDRADAWAWNELPESIPEPFRTLVQQLASVREPVNGLPDQLIHGDLNPDNILIAPGLPPAIIDFTPYWRPADFGSAVAAYWFGPFVGDATVLGQFAGIPAFDQLLVRAGLRMLLTMVAFNSQRELAQYRTATDIIYRHVTR